MAKKKKPTKKIVKKETDTQKLRKVRKELRDKTGELEYCKSGLGTAEHQVEMLTTYRDELREEINSLKASLEDANRKIAVFKESKIEVQENHGKELAEEFRATRELRGIILELINSRSRPRPNEMVAGVIIKAIRNNEE